MTGAELLLIQGGTSILSAGINALGQRKQIKAQREQIAARQAIMKKQMDNLRIEHAVSTYSKYISNAQAGAQRVNKGLVMSGTSINASATNRMMNIFMRNDLTLSRHGLNTELTRVQDNINLLETQKAPARSFMSLFGRGLAKEVPGALSTYLGYKYHKDELAAINDDKGKGK